MDLPSLICIIIIRGKNVMKDSMASIACLTLKYGTGTYIYIILCIYQTMAKF